MWFHGHACPCIRCVPEPNAAAQAGLLLLRLCVLTPPSGTIDTPIPTSACPSTATARGTPEYPCHFPTMANGYAALSSHVCVAPPCRIDNRSDVCHFPTSLPGGLSMCCHSSCAPGPPPRGTNLFMHLAHPGINTWWHR